MNKHLTGVMVAVFTATVLITAPAFADHRPGNIVVMGETMALTVRAGPIGAFRHNELSKGPQRVVDADLRLHRKARQPAQ